MYLYQPCLLTLALYAWAFDGTPKGRRLRIWAPVGLLFLSEWALCYERVEIYPAALLLPALYGAGRARTVSWAEVLTAAILGGLICWKVGDAWPLMPALTLLCSSLLLIPVMTVCRAREDRLLACALGSLLFELFACLREYMLFSFCVVRLGSREALSLGAAALCLYALSEQVIRALNRRKSRALPTEIE